MNIRRTVSRSGDGFVGARSDYMNVQSAHGATETTANRLQPTQLRQTVHSLDPVEPATAPLMVQDEDLIQFDMPRYTPPERPTTIVRKKKRWLRLAGQSLLATFCLALIVGGGLFWRGYSNIHKVFRGNGTVAALSTTRVAPNLLKGEGDGRVNILMLGVGGKNHPGGDLTDTIMVFSVDPVNNKAAMLSVPRDMWVKMPVSYFGAYQKINAAYSSGKYSYLGKSDLSSDNQNAVEAGFSSIDQAVGTVLGINIQYNVLVDFQAFEQAINTVDGVTVNVTEQLYDPTMAWENAHNPVLAAPGVQTMNGKKALMYARSRETSSDFARSERQRQLLVALKQKILTLGTLSSPTRISNLMSAFGDNVRTDMSTEAASRLYTILKRIDDSSIASLSLTSPTSLVTTDRVGDASVVRPKAGFNTYSDIQSYVRSQLRDGYILREHASVYVLGASDALRAHTVNTLSPYGYTMSGSRVSQNLPAGITIVDLTDGAAPYTLHYLQDRYGIAAINALPKGIDVPVGTQFAIIAGI